ncbi:MAG: MerR family transcriptional regulator [Polyangiales bacterium]
MTPSLRPLRIGELARLVGLSPDTLRHYERLGLLLGVRRTRGGFREFDADAAGRVRTIQAALALGFSLRELAELLRQRAAGKPPCRKARAIAARRLHELDEELTRLNALRAALGEIVSEWDAQLARTAEGTPARLLDSLPDRLDRQLAREAGRSRRATHRKRGV